MKRTLVAFLVLSFSFVAHAFTPLPVSQVFVLKPVVSGQNFQANLTIAEGYHLYRDHFSVQVSDSKKAQVGDLILPPGIPKEDSILGKYQVYEKNVIVTVPFRHLESGHFDLIFNYQGCADSGFCYPPQTQVFHLQSDGKSLILASNQVVNEPGVTSNQDRITQLLSHKNIFLVLLAFLGFGFLLAFTPCVLPMIPILSGIIVGEGDSLTTRRAFLLSLTYVLAMAVTYALAGVAVGLAGSYVQAMLQNSWILVAYSIVFVLLALSLFGFYELRLPSFLHHHVTNISNRQRGGSYVGVAIMGVLSTLIVSPCVSAPLVGALSYISKTGDAVLGGIALFCLGLGMGIPLLIVGTTEGKFLPRAGKWMDTVKSFFGVLLLAVAIELLSRVVTPTVTMLFWAMLLIISAVYMGAFTHLPETGWGKCWKGISVILLVYGFLLLMGASMGNTNPLQPLALRGAIPVTQQPEFQTFQVVTNEEELDTALNEARSAHQPVLLDFYANWCVSCQKIDQTIFQNPAVQRRLQNFILIRADVTANDQGAQAMEKRFNVIAPPAILFFDELGNQLDSNNMVGEISVQDFLARLSQVVKQCGSAGN